MKIIAIIPSRFQSSRFPGKPLALINNKPMVQHVYEKVKSIKKITDVYVATDDERISNKVRSFGGEVVLTSPQNSGADRVFQAYKIINKPFDLILNIQGDEPLIKVSMILTGVKVVN